MILVPNVLGDHSADAEAFYAAVMGAGDGALDMHTVDFIRPYGVIALLCAARAYHRAHGAPLVLHNLRGRVHPYLERVDLFRVAGDVLQADGAPSETWNREQPTPNLLELTPVSGADDVLTVITQAERIFAYWLHVRNLRSLLGVLSELCSNVYQHSGDSRGVVMIQTHKAVTKGQVRVRVAIGDMGVGVRGSLEGRFGAFGAEPLDYLLAAMGGKTSRHTGRGGLGLRIVEQTVGEGGGYMWLRSETAAILTDGAGALETRRGLPYVAGTQLGVDFHAPLPEDFTE